MTRKKVLLVIVEGPSDETALGYALSHVYDKDQVYVQVIHGDITIKDGVTSTNIVTKVGDEVKKFMINNHFKPSDFKGIIHIVDTDGAFIPEKHIIEDASCDGCLYLDDSIHTPTAEGIKKRNHQKQETICRLIGTGTIRTIPYRVYYMSCNLDHVLYNKRNSTDIDKETDAYAFAATYKDNALGFLSFLCESDFSVTGNYKETWNYIQQDVHSLERHSNLRIALEEEMVRLRDQQNREE